MSDIEQRLRGENPEQCVVTDRLRANIGMPDTFQFDRDDAVELDELILEAADELARLEADISSLRSKLEEAEGALTLLLKMHEAHHNNPVHAAARRTLASLREADHA
jgi:hypothetical protein